MAHFKNKLAPIFMALIAAAVFSACGGSGQPALDSSGQALKRSPVFTTDQKYKDVTIKFGANSIASASEMLKKRGELAAYLKAELGVRDVEIMLARDYDQALKQLINHETDISWLGAISYVRGSERNKLIPLVKPIVNGATFYRSAIITRSDGAIKTLSDLRGKKVAWVDKNSTSGYLMAKALMREAGIDADRDLAETDFVGNHTAVVLNVLLGEMDAGVCYLGAQNVLVDPVKIARIKVIATTREISTEPITCTDSFPVELRDRVTEAFLRLNENGNPKFTKASDSDYNSIREVMKLLNF
ncbi:MAG TPA: phosphate/phosphite/phosphonate ABC transporter substrate-binding protein [Candidatus Wallbacteria bacterium]|nr:phosphate/phosphite/phosphonate ABC transporter substrate-binding protein [Candidatus Wallbacteria bacterium]